MDKVEVKYNKFKDKINFKINPKLEYPILSLKAEIQGLKDAATVTKKKYAVPGKEIGRSHDIPNLMKNHPKNGKLYK